MEFKVIKSNILSVQADAVVVPSNTTLYEGGKGTVSYAVYSKAGYKKLQKECKRIVAKEGGYIHEGRAIPTQPFDYDAKYIIHAVVPKWIDGEHEEYEKLSEAYITSLNVADFLQCESIVFPLMSAGHNGFDKQLAMQIAIECIRQYESDNLKNVYLAILDVKATEFFRDAGYEVAEATINYEPKKVASENNSFIPKAVVDYLADKFAKGGKEIADAMIDKAIEEMKKPENWKKLADWAKKAYDDAKERQHNV